ncbi:hypothetical protein XELAEV_18030268mg [Xenopus laevis]|uniref:G-protein coupled receptors family 3 profile domain-containing protein n=1 Tax=Xenopus laevis TaxID=8355 RepID=A0A974CTQ1_XENLA|nr:hypothetical protein XELAEV_18030268mg [Xenopus laevis]
MEILFPIRLKVLLVVLMFQVLPADAEMPRPGSGCQLNGSSDTKSSFRRYRYLLVFIYTIGEINKDPEILPNVTLGYHIFDSFDNVEKSLEGTFSILSGTQQPIPNYSCWKNKNVVGFIGDLSCVSSLSMASVTGIYRYPQISYGTRDPVFNDRTQFPSFYRTVPDELSEIDGFVELIKHFGWTWVGLIVSDVKTSLTAGKYLEKGMKKNGICLAFFIRLEFKSMASTNSIKIRETLLESTANVIVFIVNLISVTFNIFSFVLSEIPGKVWIVSSALLRALAIYPESKIIFNGILSFSIQEGEIPGFREFLHGLQPSQYSGSVLFSNVSQQLSDCELSNTIQTFPSRTGISLPKCTESELFEEYGLSLNNTFNFRISYGVYIAVYTMALALHKLHMEQQLASLSDRREKLQTHFKQWQRPKSQCNEPCMPGSRKSKIDGKLPCCYKYKSDAQTCIRCSKNEKSNKEKNGCIPRNLHFLSYEDLLGATLASFSVICSIKCSVIQGIFIKYCNTPIVRANNRNLSCLLLISLMLCFLCTLLFIGRPTQICCLLQQVIFGIVFTTSISSLLAKTLTVIIVFNATKPGSKLKKYIGTQPPIILVIICSLIEIIISIVWMASNPPFQEADTLSDPDYIILQCNEGSSFFFCCIIGYMGVLALLCFIAAFLAKDFPDRFNEAKNITFSMLVFCSVWVTFVPAYLSSKGSRMVAVEIFAILSSSAGLLACIFIPKCYMIFLKPDMNKKDNIVRKL